MLETVSFSLVDFLYDPDPKRQFDFYVPPPARAAIQRSPAYTGTIPIAALSILNYVFVTAALVFLAGRRTIRYTVSPENRRKWKLAAWIIFGVLFNALVCGAVSIPLPRYEARVIWVIPLAALLFVADDLAKRMKARTRNVAMKSAA
jgi:MFS family permease